MVINITEETFAIQSQTPYLSHIETLKDLMEQAPVEVLQNRRNFVHTVLTFSEILMKQKDKKFFPYELSTEELEYLLFFAKKMIENNDLLFLLFFVKAIGFEDLATSVILCEQKCLYNNEEQRISKILMLAHNIA